MTEEKLRLEQQVIPSGDLVATILSQELPFDVDWRRPAMEMDLDSRWMRLARLKAILPPDNAIEEKTTNDVTLENYVRLALEAAGNVETLDGFLSHIEKALDQSDTEGAEFLANQVLWIWAPAAEIAGLYNQKVRLQELAFKLGKPGEYRKVTELFGTSQSGESMDMLNSILDDIDTVLELSLEGVRVETSSRQKSKYGVWQKLEKGGNSEIFDLLGIRVVIDGEEEAALQHCYAAMHAIAGIFGEDQLDENGLESDERFKNYIKYPKPSGYQSLHLTLYTPSGMPFEVQIRTRAMDDRSRTDPKFSHQGYAAAFKPVPGKVFRTYQKGKVPKIYSWRNDAAEYIRQHDGETEGLLGEEILFFGADGNLYRNIAGLNALDASFRIHSRRALKTWRMYVNGVFSDYRRPIGHGDTLEIEYHPDYPKDEDRFNNLKFQVTTDYARKAVEKARKRLMAPQYREAGRLIVLSMIDTSIDPKTAFDPLDEVDRRYLADRVGARNFEHVLEIIGAGGDTANGKPGRIAKMINDRHGLGDIAGIKLVRESLTTLADQEVEEAIVIPSTSSQPKCRVAGCCSEKISRGDEVIARPSRIEGLFKVHRSRCPNVTDLDDAIFCSWS